MELEVKDLEELLQEELPLECAIHAHLIGNEFRRCSGAVVVEHGACKEVSDEFVWFADTAEILKSQKEDLEELEVERQEWFAESFIGSPYSWWLDDFIDKVNVAQGKKEPSDPSNCNSPNTYRSSTNTSGLVSFLSLLGRASAGAYNEYDSLPHVQAARTSSAREEAISTREKAISKCPQDVAEVICKNAPNTMSIERKSNSKGDRYKCYDVNGILLGRVFGASGQRYWKKA